MGPESSFYLLVFVWHKLDDPTGGLVLKGSPGRTNGRGERKRKKIRRSDKQQQQGCFSCKGCS